EAARQAVGSAPAVRGGVPRADDGDHRLGWELPPDEKPRRRVMDLLEPRRIARIAQPNSLSLPRLRGGPIGPRERRFSAMRAFEMFRVGAHPLSRYCSASATCRGTITCRSIRSRIGPESRAR